MLFDVVRCCSITITQQIIKFVQMSKIHFSIICKYLFNKIKRILLSIVHFTSLKFIRFSRNFFNKILTPSKRTQKKDFYRHMLKTLNIRSCATTHYSFIHTISTLWYTLFQLFNKYYFNSLILTILTFWYILFQLFNIYYFNSLIHTIWTLWYILFQRFDTYYFNSLMHTIPTLW